MVFVNLLFATCTRKPDSIPVNITRTNKHTDIHLRVFSKSVLNRNLFLGETGFEVVNVRFQSLTNTFLE